MKIPRNRTRSDRDGCTETSLPIRGKRGRCGALWLAFLLALLVMGSGAWAAPTITLSAQRQVVNPGSSVTFNARVTGSGYLPYQWFHNGWPIKGATGSSLTLSNVKYADRGYYQIRVMDSSGYTFSNASFLHVAVPSPRIRAWGWNYGRPIIDPPQLSDVVSIAAGGHGGLALRSNGTVVAFGEEPAVPAGLSDVVAIAVGGVRLALKSDGTVVGWGYYYSGQTTVPAGLSGVVAIAAGDYHALALKSDGTVVAWKYSPTYPPSDYGAATVPTGLSGVVAIAAGPTYSLALKSKGSLVVWGAITALPTQPSGVVDIVADGRTLALKSDGTVVDLWGSPLPTGLNSVVAIGAGTHYGLALKSDGSVVAWGGDYTGADGPSIVPPADLGYVVAVSVRRDYNLALEQHTPPLISQQPGNQTVHEGESVTLKATLDVTSAKDRMDYQWQKDGIDIPGATESSLTLDNVNISDAGSYTVVIRNDMGCVTSTPAQLSLLGPVFPPQPLQSHQVATAGTNVEMSVAATGSGTLSYQWFHDGLAIEGATSNPLVLADVQYSDRGYYTVKVTDSEGTVTSLPAFLNILMQLDGMDAWGNNDFGKSTIPSGLSGVVAVAAGYAHNLALKADGTVVAWGYNGSGQTDVPTGLSGVVSIAAGRNHNLALKSDGTVVAWGDNQWGQTDVPTGLSGVVAIAAGVFHSLALKSDGTVVAWGTNYWGQTDVPTGLSGVVAISAGYEHSLALKSDGTVVAWGDNYWGQTDVPTGLSGVVAISAGWRHCLALKSDGTVVAWGNNQWNQSTVPTGLSDVVAIAAGGYHSLALQSDGTVVSWGNNNHGQSTVPRGLGGVVAITAGVFHSLVLEQLSVPLIASQPTKQVITQGGSATFSVNATGGALSYQWQKDGADIPGATSYSLTLNAVGTADPGVYTVTISNRAGSVTSNKASLYLQATSTTGRATATHRGVILNGSVNPNGQAATYYFEYGKTTSYGARTASKKAGQGIKPVAVSASLAGLPPDTTFHYRLVAVNSTGTVYGSDQTFTTDKLPAWVPPSIFRFTQAAGAQSFMGR